MPEEKGRIPMLQPKPEVLSGFQQTKERWAALGGFAALASGNSANSFSF